MKALVDANILISAAGFGGIPKAVIDLGFEVAFDLVVDHRILDDLERKLVSRIGMTRTEAHDLRIAVEAIATVVEPSDPEPAARDPDDDYVLAAAVEGQVDVVVTGDKDLLVLGSHRGIEILTPRAFLDRLTS